MTDERAPLKPLVEIGETPMDCWEWSGKIHKVTGYGCKRYAGKDYLAHRWIWIMLFGPIPDELVVNHLCSNRSCVNPHHLEVTDQAGNCRHGKGTKLNISQVKEIKEAKSNRVWGGAKKLADKFGVSSALIHDIWNGRAWKEI